MFSFISGKVKLLYLIIRRLLFEKPKMFCKEYIGKDISVEPNQIFLHMSSTAVLELHIDERVLFFRQCNRHCSRRKYVENFIDFYFDYLSKDLQFSVSDKYLIKSCLKSKDNFRKFINLENTIREKCGGGYHHTIILLISFVIFAQ